MRFFLSIFIWLALVPVQLLAQPAVTNPEMVPYQNDRVGLKVNLPKGWVQTVTEPNGGLTLLCEDRARGFVIQITYQKGEQYGSLSIADLSFEMLEEAFSADRPDFKRLRNLEVKYGGQQMKRLWYVWNTSNKLMTDALCTIKGEYFITVAGTGKYETFEAQLRPYLDKLFESIQF